MPTEMLKNGWHLRKEITLNQILALVVQALVLTGAIAGFWLWLNSSISEAANKAESAADEISSVASDVRDVDQKADEAMVLARSNSSGLTELRGRVSRNEERQSKRDREVLDRLKRIEDLLLEERQKR